jgi:hypothetical protein
VNGRDQGTWWGLGEFRNNSACILGVILVGIGYLSSRSAMGRQRWVVGEGLFA